MRVVKGPATGNGNGVIECGGRSRRGADAGADSRRGARAVARSRRHAAVLDRLRARSLLAAVALAAETMAASAASAEAGADTRDAPKRKEIYTYITAPPAPRDRSSEKPQGPREAL